MSSGSTATASLRSSRRRPRVQASVGAAGARQRPRPRARHLDHGLWRRRQAAGNLDCLSRAAAVGRSLSRDRGVAVAQRARRRRRRHGALHPRAGADRSADRGGRGRARRRATSACASASRSRCATAIRWSTGRRSRSWRRCRRRRARKSSSASSGRRCRSMQQIALVDAVAEAAANPMFDVQYGPQAVQWCTHELLEAIARCLGAHRPPHPHAPAGDQHPARVARRQLSRRHPEIPRRHRLPEPAADARPLHLGAARRAGADRRARRDDLGQHQLEPASAFGHRAAEGDGRSAAAAWRSASTARRSTRTTTRSARCGWRTCCTRASAFTTDVDRPAMLRMAFQNGRLSVTNKDDGGALAPGEPADILVLDWDAVDHERLRADLDPQRPAVRAHHHASHPRADRRRPLGRARRPGARHRLPGDARRYAGAACAPTWRRTRRSRRRSRELERAVAAHYQSDSRPAAEGRHADRQSPPHFRRRRPTTSAASKPPSPRAASIRKASIAVLGKTEGNGLVNDFARGYAALALNLMFQRHLPADAGGQDLPGDVRRHRRRHGAALDRVRAQRRRAAAKARRSRSAARTRRRLPAEQLGRLRAGRYGRGRGARGDGRCRHCRSRPTCISCRSNARC